MKQFTQLVVSAREKNTHVIQEETFEALCTLARTRANSVGRNIQRAQHFVRALARHLGKHPKFAADLTDKKIELIFKSAALHDIGNVRISDDILLKSMQLDLEDFVIIKTHPLIGVQLLESVESKFGIKTDFLKFAKEMTLGHHERWDGEGYPAGLKGEEIPLAARLMAVADVYDAVISRRIYKKEIPHEEAIEVIAKGKGTQFDPDVVDAFIETEQELKFIALQLSGTA